MWLLTTLFAILAGLNGHNLDSMVSASLLRRALVVAKGLPGDTAFRQDRSRVIASIAKAQAVAGDVRGAISSMRELAPPGIGPGTLPESQLRIECLISLSQAQAKLGKRGDSVAFARQASELIGFPGDMSSTNLGMPYLLSTLALAREASGEVRDGEAIRQDALQAASQLRDERARDNAIAMIAVDQASGGDVQGAISLVNTRLIGEGPWGVIKVSQVFEKIARARVRFGDFDGAVLASRKIHNLLDRTRMLIEIARQQDVRGNKAEAEKHLTSARRITEGIESGKDRVIGLLKVYAALTQRGDVPPAKAILDRVEQTIKAMEPVAQVTPLLALSMTSSELGKFREAEGRLAEATRVVDELGDEKLKRRLQGDIDYARSAFLVYSGGDLPPDLRKSNWVLTIAIEKALSDASRGDLEAVTRTAAIFHNDPEWATDVEHIFEALARAGKGLGATTLAENLPNQLVKARAFLGIASGMSDQRTVSNRRQP